MEVNKDLQDTYDKYYEGGITEWRELGARQKARNIMELSGSHSFQKVVEFGAGDGSILAELNKYRFADKLYALEISDSGIEAIKQRDLSLLVDAQKFDGYKTSYPDNFFDLAILSHVLEHVEYPRTLLRELKRISKHQIIEVPRDYSFNVDKKVESLIDYGHINVYTPTLLRFLLKTEKFQIISDKKAFYPKEIIAFSWKGGQKTLSFYKKLKLEIYIILRTLAYFLFPERRKEVMINTYTVLTK
jgi:ubiquinone/menaquinone biosynthesis C-methylase UbiE